MIVKMLKLFLIARSRDRDRLLETVRDLGVLHLVPADPSQAVVDEETADRLQGVERAVQVLSGIVPAGTAPKLAPVEAAQEVLDIQRHTAERHNRLAALHHQLEQLRIWGDVKLEQIEQLRAAGIAVRFFSVPDRVVDQIEAECSQVLGELPGGRSLVAVVNRRGEPGLPEGSVLIPLPPRDAPAIRAEAAELDAGLKQDAQRLGQLAHLVDAMRAELVRLQEQADYTVALRSAAGNEDLFAMQGWIPQEKADSLRTGLAEAGLPAAVETFAPTEDEQPPTLIRSPAWTRPIDGLFNILGTVAGYREFDVSIPFLLALPIFTAILISDAGYGAILMLGPLLFYRKVSRTLGSRFTQLLIIIGAVSFLWGCVCASFFGFIPYPPLISVDMSEESRFLLMRMSFVIGAIHLSIAQLWPAVRMFPDLRFLNRVGWAVFIWGMLGVVQMFVLKVAIGWDTPWPYLLIVGAGLAILFHTPSLNVAKMVGSGVANFPLAMLSAFSDVISYVRLMAVGLASGVLSASFNNLAFSIDLWPATIAVLLFGHGLNLGLALIAMFAHGVRLNMLEFSNNLGMQWTGYPYSPFLNRTNQES